MEKKALDIKEEQYKKPNKIQLDEITKDEAIKVIKQLYRIIDNISSLGDLHKGQDLDVYNKRVDSYCEHLKYTILYSDGYNIFINREENTNVGIWSRYFRRFKKWIESRRFSRSNRTNK